MFDFISHYSLRMLSVASTLSISVILLMLNIPYTKEWRDFRNLRSFLAVTCILLSVANFVRCVVQKETEHPAVLSSFTLFVASYQALLFTAASLVFMQIGYNHKRFLVGVGVITAVGAVLLVSLFCFPRVFLIVFWMVVAAYVLQISYYTYIFKREYKRCIIRLERFYDEEMSGRLRWVYHCFYSALGVGILALLFSIIPVPMKIYDLFILAYTVYYVYIAGCVVNYRANAGFIVRVAMEAPIECWEETQVEDTPAETADDDAELTLSGEKEYALRQALSAWIENKRFTVKDTNLDDIAKELGTSQRLLSAFFSKYAQVSFRTWRTKLRIDEACRLLREDDDLQLKSLNDLVGMGDYSYFYKQFKSTTGMSPTDYRNKYYHKSPAAKSDNK